MQNYGLKGFFPLILVSSLLFVGCKKDASEEAPVAAGSAQAGGDQGPCAKYSTLLCGFAKNEQSTCESIKTTTDLMPAAACEAGLKDPDYAKKRLAEQRGACDELVKKLCTEIGPKTESCTMVTEQTKSFPPERCKMLMGKYAEVVAELKKHEAANQPLSAELQATIAADDAPAFGPKNAKVTVVEFSDFQCPYCSKAAEVLHQVREKYGDKVRLVFRQFPLSFHDRAHEAAQASLAAHAQGKFWPYHDRLFGGANELDRPALERYAKEAGLNLANFKAALDEKKYAVAVDSDLKLGEKVSVQGTPTMFVNGQRVANPTDFGAVAKLIDDALAKG